MVRVAASLVTFLLTAMSCQAPVDNSQAVKEEIAAAMEKSLIRETLDVWYPACVDTLHGGFLTSYTFDFKPVGEQDKMIVSQARHLWTTAKSMKRYPHQSHFARAAEQGFRFLRDAMWDEVYGGFYTLTSRDGKVIDESKNTYGNAFAIFALAAYFDASGDTSSLELAKRCFRWLENYSHDIFA